jgi:hypothetical protein
MGNANTKNGGKNKNHAQVSKYILTSSTPNDHTISLLDLGIHNIQRKIAIYLTSTDLQSYNLVHPEIRQALNITILRRGILFDPLPQHVYHLGEGNYEDGSYTFPLTPTEKVYQIREAKLHLNTWLPPLLLWENIHSTRLEFDVDKRVVKGREVWLVNSEFQLVVRGQRIRRQENENDCNGAIGLSRPSKDQNESERFRFEFNPLWDGTLLSKGIIRNVQTIYQYDSQPHDVAEQNKYQLALSFKREAGKISLKKRCQVELTSVCVESLVFGLNEAHFYNIWFQSTCR